MIELKSSRRFIVQGTIAESDQPSTLVQPGNPVFLTMKDGYYQWTLTFTQAYLFSSENEAQVGATTCPGPWYLKPDPKSVKVIPGTYYLPFSGRFIADPTTH